MYMNPPVACAGMDLWVRVAWQTFLPIYHEYIYFSSSESVVGRGRESARHGRGFTGLSFKTATSHSPGPTADLFPTITGRTTSCGRALWTHLGDSEDIRTRSLRGERPLGSAVRDCGWGWLVGRGVGLYYYYH